MKPTIPRKILAFKEESREKLMEGIEILANAVTTTLGPKGRNVAIQRQWGLPIVVHDGVTVAEQVADDDELRMIGINLVREAAKKTNEEAGDGTTTATLLAYEIAKRGQKLINDGMNPMVLRSQIYKALPKLLIALKENSKEIKNTEEIARVAYISSADEEIGKLVAEAIEKVGKDGLVTVDEGKGIKTEVEYTEGMEFNKGWASPYFITNEQRMEAVVENPVILLMDKKLSLSDESIPIYEAMAKVSKDWVIIAQEITGDALATLVGNKMKGNIKALAVSAPGNSGNRREYLDDIAVLTGAKVLEESSELDLSNVKSILGTAEKVVASRDTTVIIGGKGNKEELDKRVEALRAQKNAEKSEFEKEKLEERLAKLTTGVAVVRVGAKTEIDMREKVERVKDAVGAASAARDEGVVPGGGVVFLKMRKALDGNSEGEELMREVLESPIRKLLQNSGEEVAKIGELIKKIGEDKGDLGYEVEKGELVSMTKNGIIDPAKVVRLALENAIGVATSILTTDCLIAIRYEFDKDTDN
jgi:chaperonin GroEL